MRRAKRKPMASKAGDDGGYVGGRKKGPIVVRRATSFSTLKATIAQTKRGGRGGRDSLYLGGGVVQLD